MSATVRVGTCSWADETLMKVWYPKSVRSGEARRVTEAARAYVAAVRAAREGGPPQM